jgi:hypothetical protein
MQYIHACEHVVRACWSKLKLLFMTQPIQLSHNSRSRANKKNNEALSVLAFKSLEASQWITQVPYSSLAPRKRICDSAHFARRAVPLSTHLSQFTTYLQPQELRRHTP